MDDQPARVSMRMLRRMGIGRGTHREGPAEVVVRILRTPAGGRVIRRKWIYVQVQIVGNPDQGYEEVYSWGGQKFSTQDAAIRVGIRDLGHDDFCIGRVEFGGTEGDRLIWWGWQHDEHPDQDRHFAADGLGLLS